ncbi:alpha/beta fold hydrolase [Microbacterium sp. CIAB417]|uniref:alpha/beta fold hydrolase n=1 Tax=Microbacterium sp. CIAB417 TaxID=2860287 RepID=UPI001FACCFA2|nr:alpha/beta fold hydrolase [Microbacterium sp. CIAB417]
MNSLARTFDWRGRTVAWDRFGSGPALVLLHGTPWSSALWQPIARALSAEFTVHLWDMPGYGASSKSAEHAVDLGVQGELFADLLDHWELDAPHVVAHDFGGAVALRARLLHGARFASLCLVDAVALRPWGSPFFSLVKDHAEVFAQLPPAVHRGAIEAYIAGASHRGIHPDDLAMLVQPWTDAPGQAAFYRQISEADERYTAEVEPLYSTIDEPVHIIWGAEDTWIPVDRAHRLQAAIPHASLTVLPDAGHLIQHDAPAALAAALTRWLERRGH